MKFSVILLILSTVIASALCTNYFFGEKTENSSLVLKKKVKYEALPLQKRAIKCFDYQNSDASVNVTEGGIGYDHVELRMKSQRSYRLEYSIEIY
ncbi:Uncharacterized protein OBRU01_24339, partial [Operophtera brumata]